MVLILLRSKVNESELRHFSKIFVTDEVKMPPWG